jgi:hypothetical protein
MYNMYDTQPNEKHRNVQITVHYHQTHPYFCLDINSITASNTPRDF